MKSNMKLQSDITASYALGKHQILMSYDDIAVESPYNTYSVEGLPIGPIASPSIESIRAAIKPDRKSTRLNSSHVAISYAVFCLKKKTRQLLNHQHLDRRQE